VAVACTVLSIAVHREPSLTIKRHHQANCLKGLRTHLASSSVVR
jgi:hypothetical protein